MACWSHEDDDDAEKSRFRWLDAARYTVAAVVTVLIVAVIANAIKVVLRPDTLLVSVVGGSVVAKPSPPANLLLFVDLLRQNPSTRTMMYYTDVRGYLFYNNTPSSSWALSSVVKGTFMRLFLEDVAVFQGREVQSFQRFNLTKDDNGDGNEDKIDPRVFALLSRGMRGVTMRLDGILTKQTTSQARNVSTPTTYYCAQLVVGGDPDDPAYQQGNEDVLCAASDAHQGGGRRLLRFWFSMLVPGMLALIQTL